MVRTIEDNEDDGDLKLLVHFLPVLALIAPITRVVVLS